MTAGHGRLPVVAGVDGSASSMRAMRWAASQAALWGCPLRLVHAEVWPWIQQPVVAGNPSHQREGMARAAHEWLRQAADVATETTPEMSVSTDLLGGAPAQVLAGESRRARLVVVGSRGLGGFAGLLLGSTAVALSAHAHCPVAVIRGPADDGEPARSGSVVVGVDGSPEGEAAIAFGFEAAALRGTRLVAVHAWSDVTVPDFVPMAPAGGWPVVAADQQLLLAELLAGWGEKYPDVPVQRVVTRGRPAHSLLQAAEGAQLVVVGSRGRGRLRGLLLGSTSHALLHHAPCPVVVTRVGDHGRTRSYRDMARNRASASKAPGTSR